MAPWSTTRSALGAVVATTATIVSQAQVPDIIQMSGACDSKNYLNGVYFEKQGYTANDSPYYKARDQEAYIYYDADCAGGGDGTPRWILDNDRPSLGLGTDLDSDYACEYMARINDKDGKHPPFIGTWLMECEGKWEQLFVLYLLITTTSTTTTTRTATTSTVTGVTVTATRTTLTRSGTRTRSTTVTYTGYRRTETTTRAAYEFVLRGLCQQKAFLNGLVFKEQGRTANGSPYFKSSTSEEYLYYDIDCDAGRNGSPRWVISSRRPALDKFEDVDGDGTCSYHARQETDLSTLPAAASSWRVFCGQGWVDLPLELSFDPLAVAAATALLKPASSDPEPPIQTEPTPNSYRAAEASRTTLRISGACQERNDLNSMEFVQEGTTATGAPYYVSKYVVPDQYIYYDPACSGPVGDTEARWVIDVDRPNTTAREDLDGDRKCDHQASVVGASPGQVPPQATWRMRCGGDWRDVKLTISTTTEVRSIPVSAAPPSSRRGTSVVLLGAAVAACLVLTSAL